MNNGAKYRKGKGTPVKCFSYDATRVNGDVYLS